MYKHFLKKINTFLPFQCKLPLNYIIPVYHSVSNEKLPHLNNIINYKNIKNFEIDLDFLLQKYEFLDWRSFKEKYNKKNEKPFALLTFDDGYLDFNHGNADYWIVKINNVGIIQWQKSLGGTGNDYAYSIQQTNDGGYIVGGESNSHNGDVIGIHGLPYFHS